MQCRWALCVCVGFLIVFFCFFCVVFIKKSEMTSFLLQGDDGKSRFVT